MCLGTFVFVGSGHVVSMFIRYKIDHFYYSCDKVMKYDFLWKIIHIEPLTNTINTILWCIWVKSHAPIWQENWGREEGHLFNYCLGTGVRASGEFAHMHCTCQNCKIIGKVKMETTGMWGLTLIILTDIKCFQIWAYFEGIGIIFNL